MFSDNYGNCLDVAKGLLIATYIPIGIVYLSVLFLVQLITGMTFQYSSFTEDDEDNSIVGSTLVTQKGQRSSPFPFLK